MIDISGEAWQKSDFYELDKTIDLVKSGHL